MKRKVFWLTPDEFAGFYCPSQSFVGKPVTCNRPDCPVLITHEGVMACAHEHAPRYEPITATAKAPSSPIQPRRTDPLPCHPQRGLRYAESKCPACGGAVDNYKPEYLIGPRGRWKRA